MVPAFSFLGLGFLLGLRHATDGDHVAAVSTIVSRERRLWASSLVGALWGVGHTVTLLLAGGAIVLFNLAIPRRVGIGLELAVASMLAALGAIGLFEALARHKRERGSGNPLDRRATATPARPIDRVDGARVVLRPFIVGIVHGLAGSAAVALMVLSTIRSAAWAVVYLVVFGLGTVAGMVLLTTAIGLPFAYTSRRFRRLNTCLAAATCLGSLGFGALIAYELVSAH
jgi:high-affinity nickel-transport protein